MFYFVFIICLITILLMWLKKYKAAKILAIILLFSFAIIMSLSKDLGIDYSTYKYNYDINYYYMTFSPKEFIWSILFIVSKFFNLDFVFLMMIVKLLTVSFFYLGLKNLKLNDFSMAVAIICYILIPSITFLNIVRQGLAISIFFYAFSFINKGNLNKYTLWSLVAFFIHSSILIVFLIVLSFYYFNLKKYKLLRFRYLIIIELSVFIFVILLILFKDFFGELFTYFLSIFAYNYDLQLNQLSLNDLFAPIVISNSILITFVIYTEMKDNCLSITQLLCFFGILLNIASITSYLFDRVGILFSSFNPYLISILANDSDTNIIKNNLIYLVLAFYCVCYILNVFINGEANNLQYIFYF